MSIIQTEVPEKSEMKNDRGKIIKGIGGFYYVKTENSIVECRARGKFRKDSILPYVGDNVQISVNEDNTGYVVSIDERKNSFIRPPIANIDKLLIVASLSDPEPDTLFIDKMLVCAEANNVKAAICFNKSDLSDDREKYVDIYKSAGYDVFLTSALSGSGTEDLRVFMKSCTLAVCGFSGVGKSTLLNSLTGLSNFATGEISRKLNRGKHTTRHVELVEYEKDSYIADTPGFSMLELPAGMTSEILIDYFPDLKVHTGECKFSDCGHTSDKFCSVYDALVEGKISESRYENYKYLYNEISNRKNYR